MTASSSSTAPTPVDPRQSFPKRFVPDSVRGGDWPIIEQLGTALLERPCATPSDLERWLEDMGELTACVVEEEAWREIAFKLRTDDPEASRAHLEWIREIQPRWEKLEHRLMEAYLANPHRTALPPRYRVWDRNAQSRHDLFREENLSLQVTEAEHSQAYEKLRGAMTITYGGQEYTLQQADRFLESADRGVRQTVWALAMERQLAERRALDALFDELLAVRAQIARNAGLPSYREYAWRARHRFDYGVEECVRFHHAVETHFVPLGSRIARERARAMGLARLQPWDAGVDPLGRAPLAGLEQSEIVLDRCEAVLRAVAPVFGDWVRYLRDEGLVDIERRKGKAPGATHVPLSAQRRSFIFSNISPAFEVQSLVHEFGHAAHYLLARSDPLMAYRRATSEFAEVASMTMELFAAPHLGLVYDRPSDARRAYRQLLDTIVITMTWVAAVDAFQHWVYEHPNHTVGDREAAWVSIYGRFHPGWVDWSGHEAVRASRWQLQRHIYQFPFYFIDYGIAQTAALQLWRRAAEGDVAGAVASYRAALSLGGSRPLPELFEAAGLRFAFDAEAMAPLVAALSRALDELPYRDS